MSVEVVTCVPGNREDELLSPTVNCFSVPVTKD
jgi:hypothetical protein